MQESQVAENGSFPVYGATGISGYTETADVNGESILIIKDGSGVGTVKFVTGEYSYIGTLNRTYTSPCKDLVLSHIKQEWLYHTSILRITEKPKSFVQP